MSKSRTRPDFFRLPSADLGKDAQVVEGIYWILGTSLQSALSEYLDTSRVIMCAVNGGSHSAQYPLKKANKYFQAEKHQLWLERRIGESDVMLTEAHLVKLLRGVVALWSAHGDSNSPFLKRVHKTLEKAPSIDATRLKGEIVKAFPSLNALADEAGKIRGTAIIAASGILLGATCVALHSSQYSEKSRGGVVSTCVRFIRGTCQNDPIIRDFRLNAFESPVMRRHATGTIEMWEPRIAAAKWIANDFINLCESTAKEESRIDYLKPFTKVFLTNPYQDFLQECGRSGSPLRIMGRFMHARLKPSHPLASRNFDELSPKEIMEIQLSQSTITPPNHSLASKLLDPQVAAKLAGRNATAEAVYGAWDNVANKTFKRMLRRFMNQEFVPGS